MNRRHFHSDLECSTEEQRERQRRACEAWARGALTAIPIGFGSTHNRAEEARWRRLRRLLDELA